MKKRLLLATTCALAACGGGAGTLEVTTYGEDFIEREIPAASAPGEEGFVDGFTVTFSEFLVAFSELRIEDRKGVRGAALESQRIFDLTRPGPHTVATFGDVPAQRWDRVGVTISPARSAAAGNASEAAVARMNDGGLSVLATGEARKGSERWSFSFGFDHATRYDECETEDGAGVVVPSGGTATMELTVHGDHLFYDDLQSDEAVLRFTAFAEADGRGDGDRIVTLEELAAVDLTTLPAEQYGTGGAASIVTLRDFVAALTRSLIHFQGEGDCRQTPL